MAVDDRRGQADAAAVEEQARLVVELLEAGQRVPVGSVSEPVRLRVKALLEERRNHQQAVGGSEA